MVVSTNAGNTGPDGLDAATVIIGIDRETSEADGTVIVYLNNALIDNIQPTNNNDDIDFDFSEVTATGHGLVIGDVIYIDQGTGNAATTAGTYTIHSVEDANTFTTEPALDGAGDLTLYSSIFFAERFTNGPYSIQNDGDQIKVTLNVSSTDLLSLKSISWYQGGCLRSPFYFAVC